MPEHFSVSSKIEQRAKNLLEEVLPDVEQLPEGVSVVDPSEAVGASKPFVVVSFRHTVDEALKAYNAGAMRYVTMDFNREALKNRLNGS